MTLARCCSALRRSVRSRSITPKPATPPASSAMAVTVKLDHRRVPPLQTCQPSVSKRPSRAAAVKARAAGAVFALRRSLEEDGNVLADDLAGLVAQDGAGSLVPSLDAGLGD